MGHRAAPRAESDLDEIWFYVARRSGSVEIANGLIDSITDRFVLLAQFPHIGRPREDDFGFGFRSFAVGDYVIVYRVDGEDVEILRVAHGKTELRFMVQAENLS